MSPRHTPEPWQIRAFMGGNPIAFEIGHPIPHLADDPPSPRFFEEPICMVWGGEHARANADLIRLSPRIARMLDHLVKTVMDTERGSVPHTIFVAATEGLDLLAELKKAGGL